MPESRLLRPGGGFRARGWLGPVVFGPELWVARTAFEFATGRFDVGFGEDPHFAEFPYDMRELQARVSIFVTVPAAGQPALPVEGPAGPGGWMGSRRPRGVGLVGLGVACVIVRGIKREAPAIYEALLPAMLSGLLFEAPGWDLDSDPLPPICW